MRVEDAVADWQVVAVGVLVDFRFLFIFVARLARALTRKPATHALRVCR